MTASVELQMPDDDASDLLQLSTFNVATTMRSLTELTRAAGSAWAGAARGATPGGMLTRGLQWWTAMCDRRPPRWQLANEVVIRTPFATLRDFTEPADADRDVMPTLVLPPQAGHTSMVADFSPTQSQLAVIRAAGLVRLHALEWLGATAATTDVAVTDYLELIDRAVRLMGGRANLIGDCQGGWLAAIYAALHPERVHTLTLAGAPIDFHAGKSVIAASTRALTTSFGLAPYRALVAAGGGNMPGRAVLGNFIAIQPQSEISRQLQLLEHLDDDAHVERYHAFEDWFKHTQDIPGAFYLWLVEHLFWGNELITDRLLVAGRPAQLGAIRCPLYLLAGSRDHITPAAQVFAARDAVGTPPADISCRLADAGHLGLFMGRDALRTDWPPLLAAVYARSAPGSARPVRRRWSPVADPTGTPRVPAP